ncbi:MAG: PAS domain-containing protein [Rhodobacteraceae bacterium]|nr:PAS domain-containing protein [Paracoccaceae bacterium]
MRLPPRFDSPSCRYFYDAWCEVAGGEIVPSSSDFLDHAPVELMPYAFIHDIHPEGVIVRFMGTGLVQRWRHDLTGQYFGDQLAQFDRDRLLNFCQTVVHHPCGMRQIGHMASSMGRSLSFEAVMLPLRSDSAAPPRVIVFSQILGNMVDKEHSSDFEQSGMREWIDLGNSIPADAPPAG